MKLLIHFLTAANYELHLDGMLYWAFGDHLAFGYASNPPFIGFLSWVMQNICGHSEFCVKLLPALAGGVAILLVALMVKEFGGKLLAVIIACAAFLVSPAYLRSNLLFQPVCFDELFWMLIIYLALRLINTRNPVYWLWIAASAGIGFMNKYSVVFLITGLALALIMSPHRILYRSRYLLYAILLGFVIIFPNLVWQYLHNWPVVGHMRELQETQLVNVTLSGFIEGQVLMNFPGILVWLTGLLVLLFSKKERRFLFISLMYFIVIILLIIARGKHYYSLGLYPVLLAAGGYILEKYLHGKLVYVNYILIIVMVAIAGLILPFSLPVMQLDRMERFCKNAA